MGRDWAEGWSKGGCVGRKLMRGFFGTVSGASSCVSAGLLFPIAGITRIAARQQDTWRTPREAGDHLAEGLCCGQSLGRVCLHGRVQAGAAWHVPKVGHLSLGSFFCSHPGLQWHGPLESCHHRGAGIEEFSCWIRVVFLIASYPWYSSVLQLHQLLGRISSLTQLKKKK